MKVKLGNLRFKQLSELCRRQTGCYKCPALFACDNDPCQCDLEAEIEVPDELLPKPVSLCRLRNEDRCSMYCEGFDTSCEDYKPVEEE